MSKICVTTNILIFIFVSTYKHLTQSEQMEFSKNGVFHSKCVVIFFKMIKLKSQPCPYLEESIKYRVREILKIATLYHFTPLLLKIYRNQVNQNSWKVSIHVNFGHLNQSDKCQFGSSMILVCYPRSIFVLFL